MINYKSCKSESLNLIHTCDPCNVAELGRVRSLALIKKGTTITLPFDVEEWRTAIEAGNIIVLPDTIGSFDGGSPKMGSGYGDETERKLGDDYVLTVKDPAYANNVDFWQSAESEVWNVAFRSETKLQYVDADVKLTAKAPIEEGLDSEVVWNVELKWFSKFKPKVSDVEPIKELFRCFEITEDGE